MHGIDFRLASETWVETAIVAKWALYEAWHYCVEVLDQRLKYQLIPVEEKMKMEEMYTSFFHQAFYAEVKTKADIEMLVKNARKMLSMLKKLDETIWAKFMVDNR
jgi:hypothetical protein